MFCGPFIAKHFQPLREQFHGHVIQVVAFEGRTQLVKSRRECIEKLGNLDIRGTLEQG